jgi:hypothetical protein
MGTVADVLPTTHVGFAGHVAVPLHASIIASVLAFVAGNGFYSLHNPLC